MPTSPRSIRCGRRPTSPATSRSRSTTRSTPSTPISPCSGKWPKARPRPPTARRSRSSCAPVSAKDCVATIQRFGKRDPMGTALIARTDEVSAPDDKTIKFRLKTPFPLLTYALAQVYCAIMPERLAKTDAFTQVTEAIGSGPFKFVASERIPGQRVVFEKNPKYVPRSSGNTSFYAGPKVVNIDRVVWNYIQDPATASAALTQGEVDWWE